MKTLNKLFFGALMLMGMASCSMESPFTVESGEATGRLLKSNIALDVKGVNPITKALNAGVPEVSDFKVEIYKEDQSAPYQIYENYGSMPEVILLPEGDYNIKVSYGGSYGNETSNAAFNAPYYLGESDNFKVEIDKIVSDIKPIVCKLQNVRVKVNFDTSLTSAMSEDSKVNVQLGNGTVLSYTKNTTEDGFFEYNGDNIKLIATFIGTVEGIEVNEAKSFDKVEAGNYYIITFKLHNADASNPGNIVPGGSEDGNGFTVDASVGYTDMNESNNPYDPSLNPDEPNNRYLEDDMRPENGQTPGSGDEPGNEEPNPDDNNDNNNPGNDDVDKNNGPVITASAGIDLDKPNDVSKLETCVLYVSSENGIKEFQVTIDSEDLVNDLIGMGWSDGNLNLVDPKEKEDFLIQLLGEDNVGENVIGKKSMNFDISDFLIMMDSFPGIHKFIVNVTDQKGLTSTATLQLEIKE